MNNRIILLILLFFVMQFALYSQDAYIGEIRLFAGNYPPVNWEICAGQLLPISNNTALYAVIGNIYGGDGRSNFALPDLRGRVPVGYGTAPGLTPKIIGQRGGTESNVITQNQLPAQGTATVSSDASKSHGKEFSVLSADKNPNPSRLENMQPYLSINYIICVRGLFPQRH